MHQYTSLSLSLLLLSRLFTAFCTQLEAVWPILSQMSQSLHEQKKFLMNKKTTNFPVVSSLCSLKKNNNFRYLWTIANSLFPIFQHIKTAPVDYLCSKSFQRSLMIYQLHSLKLQLIFYCTLKTFIFLIVECEVPIQLDMSSMARIYEKVLYLSNLS